MNLLKEDLLNFRIEKQINPNNLIYKYKTKGISPKDFSNYQNLIDLFINLRDGNVDPKEVLKNEMNFKSGLGEIKKENQKNELLIELRKFQNIQRLL